MLLETTELTNAQGETFESLFRIGSKADKRAEYALHDTTKRYMEKLHLIELLMVDEGLKAFTLLKDKVSNKKLGRYLVKHYLLLDGEVRNELKYDLVKLLLKEISMYELPLNSYVSQLQLRTDGLFKGDMTLKRKFKQGEVSNMMASILAAMAYEVGMFSIAKKEAYVDSDGKAHHSYDLVHPTLQMSEKEISYLHKKNLKEPVNHPIPHKAVGSKDEAKWFSGDSIKFTASQSQATWDILNKISSFPYQINHRLYEEMKHYFRQSFPTHSEAKKFDEVVLANIGKELYFDAKLTTDNGRVNLVGYYLGAQVGLRNALIEIHDDYKQLLTGKDKAKLVEMIKELNGSKKPKDIVLRASYLMALEDANNGKPVGVLVDYDGKLSGQQGMAVLTRSKHTAKYCGLIAGWEDGYLNVAKPLDLSREACKEGFQGYQYGAGEKTTVKAIRDWDGSVVKFADWEKAFQGTFSGSYKLMKYIKDTTRLADLGYRLDYTTPGGFNAVLTAYETVTVEYDNMFGRNRAHHLKVVKANEFGAKPVASTGHMMDSSILFSIIRQCDFHILPVHDNFRCAVWNTEKVLEAHINENRYLVSQPILEAYIGELYGDYFKYYGMSPDVSGLLENTLLPEDIVGGLF